MLILTRKIGETIIIGDDVRVTVISTQGNQIKIGIEAPISIPVHREEIHNRIKQSTQTGNKSNAIE